MPMVPREGYRDYSKPIPVAVDDDEHEVEDDDEEFDPREAARRLRRTWHLH